MNSRQRLEIAVEQIRFVRQYTNQLLDDVETELWFERPAGAPTHVAWQAGHVAMAQYGLTMLRVRGKEPEDEQLISNDFIRLFQKGTTPGGIRHDYPEPEEIRATLNRIHARAVEELENYTDRDLDVKLPQPHAVFDTKLGSVFYCPTHEMLHAGQIGLLRRLLGKPPLR